MKPRFTVRDWLWLCVNPLHLFSGTNDDNVADMISKGRNVRGEKCSGKLTPRLAAEIRERYNLIPISGSRKPRGSVARIALEYGIRPETVRAIGIGENWKHLCEE